MGSTNIMCTESSIFIALIWNPSGYILVLVLYDFMISLLINGIRQRFLEVSMVLITFLFCFDSFVHASFTITIQV